MKKYAEVVAVIPHFTRDIPNHFSSLLSVITTSRRSRERNANVLNSMHIGKELSPKENEVEMS
jgi:hypothetical protein